MTNFKIIKSFGETSLNREYVLWNVIDANDNFILETFNLKRDAKYWVEQALKNIK